MKKEDVVGIFMAMIFLVLILLTILIVFSLNEVKNTQKIVYTQKKIINNNYYVHNNYENNFYNEFNKKEGKDSSRIKKKYSSYGEHKKEYFFGTYADTFKVYVKNNVEGKYYNVNFYFKNEQGEEKKRSMRKYIFSDQKEVFHFRDISKNKKEYLSWKYTLKSE